MVKASELTAKISSNPTVVFEKSMVIVLLPSEVLANYTDNIMEGRS
jgi:hypothetical protein